MYKFPPPLPGWAINTTPQLVRQENENKIAETIIFEDIKKNDGLSFERLKEKFENAMHWIKEEYIARDYDKEFAVKFYLMINTFGINKYLLGKFELPQKPKLISMQACVDFKL